MQGSSTCFPRGFLSCVEGGPWMRVPSALEYFTQVEEIKYVLFASIETTIACIWQRCLFPRKRGNTCGLHGFLFRYRCHACSVCFGIFKPVGKIGISYISFNLRSPPLSKIVLVLHSHNHSTIISLVLKKKKKKKESSIILQY